MGLFDSIARMVQSHVDTRQLTISHFWVDNFPSIADTRPSSEENAPTGEQSSIFRFLEKNVAHISDYNSSVSGTPDADFLFGTSGRDNISGGRGADTILAGGSNDRITGGLGSDLMTGGAGSDTFIFHQGDSNPGYDNADRITDFRPGLDMLQFKSPLNSEIQATESNFKSHPFVHAYNSHNTAEANDRINFNEAEKLAKDEIEGSHGKVQFTFYSDHHNGYLFADLNHDGHMDTSIELMGITSEHNFTYLDIR